MKQIRTTIESPYEPNDNGALWLDTSNPDAPILKAFTNGKWQATIGGEKVTEISGDSTDEEIPTAKAVNDRVTELADAVGVDLDKYKEYFTIEATVDDTTVYFYRSDYGQDRGDYIVEVSTDGGATWVSKTAALYRDGGTVIASIDAGDKVLIRGTNQEYGGYDDDEGMYINFANFWADGPCYVYGNIMSLVGGDDFAGLKSMENRGFPYFFADFDGNYDGSWVLSKDGVELLLPATLLAVFCYQCMFNGCTSLTQAPALPATNLAESCYSSMFYYCTSLTTAPELPATTLADWCYNGMFSFCTSLTVAPAVLPATTLAERCYSAMFSGCASLTSAPTLPATTLAENCYESMFAHCTSLTNGPELPATALAIECYNSMFSGCTSLTSAPELPAITLADYCYSGMFSGCTSLTSAPELPATSLANNCYTLMFSGCSNLSYIKALFTTTPSNSYTQHWVNGVNSTGTFVKSTNATWNVTGNNGVPSGWTVRKQNPAQRNDQADWDETNVNSASYIWNKPIIDLSGYQPDNDILSEELYDRLMQAVGVYFGGNYCYAFPVSSLKDVKEASGTQSVFDNLPRGTEWTKAFASLDMDEDGYFPAYTVLVVSNDYYIHIVEV